MDQSDTKVRKNRRKLVGFLSRSSFIWLFRGLIERKDSSSSLCFLFYETIKLYLYRSCIQKKNLLVQQRDEEKGDGNSSSSSRVQKH